ncbi:hypothetical protein GBA52_006381 [Prunus armeniaca]|nr:hypothetical protein GBA52_006381 [Prunus armeniaca]
MPKRRCCASHHSHILDSHRNHHGESWMDRQHEMGWRSSLCHWWEIGYGFVDDNKGIDKRLDMAKARFVNLPVFVGLLKKAEEEFGFGCSGGLVLPCEVGFFKEILRFLERDESKFGRLGMEEFLKMVSEVGFDSYKELASNAAANSSCHAFTPCRKQGPEVKCSRSSQQC